MTVRLVLDVSALHSYGTVDGAMAIGELAYMIEEDQPEDQIGIPAAAFLGAYASGNDHLRTELSRLIADVWLAVGERADPAQSTFTILPLDLDNLSDVGDLERDLPGQGQAIVEAIRHGATLVTAHPPQRPLPGVDVIGLGTDPAVHGGWA